jgi:hypothetical protein
MQQRLFQTEVSDVLRKYLIGNSALTQAESAQGLEAFKALEAEVFEQLLLFDHISFKVEGENLVVPFLLKMFGVGGLESLLGQEALSFTLWTPRVTYLVADNPDIHPLQSGNLTSPAHSDPEQSLECGLLAMNPAPDRRVRRVLTKKIPPLYSLPRDTLAADAVRLANSAFESGKLRLLGFPEDVKDLRRLNQDTRKNLCMYATELLEYSFMVESGMTSYSKPTFHSIFQDSAAKLDIARRTARNFVAIATRTDVPDLRALFQLLKGNATGLPRLRAKRSAVRFRDWLASASADPADPDIVKAYIKALDAPKAFFETRKGKITKSFIKTAIGGGLGAAVAGPEGAVGGAALAHTLGEPAIEISLDLLDELLLSGLTKGWTPKMFLKDLGKIVPTANEPR